MPPTSVRRGPVRKPAREIATSLEAIYQDEDGRLPAASTVKKPEQTRGLWSCFLVVASIAGLSLWAFVFRGGGNGVEVALAIAGPESVAVGATSTYTITVKNNTGLSLTKPTLNVTYPEGFLHLSSAPEAENASHNEWKLEPFAPGEKRVITIVGKPFGSLGERKSWRVFLAYQPSNFNSELQAVATLSTVVDSSPVRLAISGPDRIGVGVAAIYKFAVSSEENLNLQVVPALPKNFIITTSSPALVKNRWSANVSASPTIFTIAGKFTGAEAAAIKGAALLPMPGKDGLIVAAAELAPVIEEAKTTLTATVNGAFESLSASPGTALDITLEFKNAGAAEIKNASLRLSFDAPSEKRQSILAWSLIKDAYDGDIQGEQISDTRRRGEITWNAKKMPSLSSIKPGNVVTVNLTLPVKDAKSFNFAAISDPTIVINASLDYAEGGALKTVHLTPLSVRIESGLFFSTNSDVSGTVHTITWTLATDFHSLDNLNVSATVFGDVAVTPGAASRGSLTFEPDTKKIIWNAGSLPAGENDSTATFTISVLKPTPTQSLLLSKTAITGTDSVTGAAIQKSGPETKLLP